MAGFSLGGLNFAGKFPGSVGKFLPDDSWKFSKMDDWILGRVI